MHANPRIKADVLKPVEPETLGNIWLMFKKILNEVATTIAWKMNAMIKIVHYFFTEL